MESPTARRAGRGGHPCQGLYHRGVGRKPKVAMIATHYQIDFSEHYLADYLATRGIGFLRWNTRFRGFESTFLLDHALVDIGVGVRWLREVQGIETVALLGNSGGGSLMAGYQAQAVYHHVTPLDGGAPAAGFTDLSYYRRLRGQRRCTWPARCPHRVDGCLGHRRKRCRWPGIRNSTCSAQSTARPSLTISSPATAGRRLPETRAITDRAEAELKLAKAAGSSDRPFTVLFRADPRMVDPALEPTKRPAFVCYAGQPVKANRSAYGIAAACTRGTGSVRGACGI